MHLDLARLQYKEVFDTVSLFDQELVLAVRKLIHERQKPLKTGLIFAKFPHECVQVAGAEKVHLCLLVFVHACLEEQLAVSVETHREHLDLGNGYDRGPP